MKLIKILFYLVVLIILLITFVPLNLYYTQISKELRPVKLENISGSAIKGSAKTVKYLGMDLGKVDWLIYPSSYNEVTIDASLVDELYDFKADIVQTSDSQMLKNLKGTADWKIIDKILTFNHGEISGYLDFDFRHIEMKNNVVHKVEGKVVTKELKLIKPIQKDMGEIEVVFTSDNPEIMVGLVNSRSNVLNVSGAVYIHKNHRWEVKLTLIPSPGEYEIEYALQNIGDRRPGGGRSLNIAGFY